MQSPSFPVDELHCIVFPRHFRAMGTSFFELDGTHSTSRIVAVLRAVKHLDVIEHISLCFQSGCVGLAANALTFERLEGAFNCDFVTPLAARAHNVCQSSSVNWLPWGRSGLAKTP